MFFWITQVRLWWSQLPKELPLPAVMIGVDVFHAPIVYDPKAKKQGRKASVAAIIVELHRGGNGSTTKTELYTESFRREGGNEYDLGEAMQSTIATALKLFNVNPASAVVWRDGISESAFGGGAAEEIMGVRKGLAGNIVGQQKTTKKCPLTYIVCQKRIATKFLTHGIPGEEDGKYGAPPGTLVSDIQGLDKQTFYINGRAPPFSTPKPVRFIVVERDEAMLKIPVARLTWGACHDYPNWTGPIKVPSVCQMAHKLAELAGNMPDNGESINSEAYLNTVHFL